MLKIETKGGERGLLLILAAVQFAHISDFMVLMPMGAKLLKVLNITPQQFSFLVSAYTFSAGILGFLGAFYIDRFDRKKAIIFIQAGFTLGTLGCAFAVDYHTLLAARVVTGAFGGIENALILSIIGDKIPFERRGAAMGIVMASFSLAAVLGVPVGLFLANHYHWQTPFAAIAALGLVLNILMVFLLPVMTDHRGTVAQRPGPWMILKDNLTDGNRILALLFMTFLMMSFFPILPFITPFLVSNIGISESDIPYIYLIGGGLTIFTSRLIGGLADAFGKKIILSIMASLTIVPIWILTNLEHAVLWHVLAITSIFFIAGNGRMVTAMSILTSVAPARARGSFMSINSAVQQLAAALASYLGSLFISSVKGGPVHGFDKTGYMAIGFAVLVVSGVWLLKSNENAAVPEAGK